jgi:ABC-2 type transport system ATP-binding protein
VLISTHILPEVEMTCGRVLILHEGKILASDTLHNLMNGDGQIIVEISAPQPDLQSCFERVAEIVYFDLMPVTDGYVRCSLTPRNGMDLRPQIFLLAHQQGWLVRELTHNQYSLEDIYLRLTKPDEDLDGEDG